MKLQRVLAISLAGMLAVANVSVADSTASVAAPSTGGSSQSSTSELFKKIRSKTRATYIFEMYGMNSQALSGNYDGAGGTNLTINHYIGAGYKIGSKWSVSMTQPFKQLIDEKPAAEADPFTASDPYVTFSNNRILNAKINANEFNMSGYIRYYAPVSRASQQKIDSASRTENGYGLLRAGLTPSLAMMDGALNFTFFNLFYYRLAKNSSAQRAAKTGNPNRDDFYYIANPILSYTLSKVFDVYLEYGAVFRHNTEGKWTNIKKEHYGAVGTYITATPKLTINPYAGIGPTFRGFRNTDIGLTMIYTLL